MVVAVSVLNAMESYLWRFIRGAGLAYGASISSEPEAQLIHFSLYRSPDSAKAFLEARKVVQALANGEMELDETTVESAKSSLHFSVADSEGTVGSAAVESFVDSVMKGTGKNRGKRLLEETSVSLATAHSVKALSVSDKIIGLAADGDGTADSRCFETVHSANLRSRNFGCCHCQCAHSSTGDCGPVESSWIRRRDEGAGPGQ